MLTILVILVVVNLLLVGRAVTRAQHISSLESVISEMADEYEDTIREGRSLIEQAYAEGRRLGVQEAQASIRRLLKKASPSRKAVVVQDDHYYADGAPVPSDDQAPHWS